MSVCMIRGRIIVMALALSACVGPTKPAVLPTLDSLPGDPQKRTERWDSARGFPVAEGTKPLPPKVNRLVTAAATAASVVGWLLSTTQNTAIGFGGTLDPVAPARPRAAPREAKEEVETDPGHPAPLVPWIRFDSPSPPR